MRTHVIAAALAFVAMATTPALATEICGNAIDDDGNNMVDEGCAPSQVSQVCESPLSCMETGMVSWSSGALHYDLQPDVAPKVPFGPSIGMRRYYTSMSTPGANPTSVNKKPLGDHWQHTYLTYIYRFNADTIILHTNDGRDVRFTTSTTVGGWQSFVPQAGFHVLSMKWNTVSPNQYQMQLLTGETVVFNSVGQVSELWDNLGPTPNKVLVTWDSTTNGNVSTVTDANGKRRLLFSYANGLMASVAFQTLASSVWTTRHTTSYDFTVAGVTRDATSGWYVPASATEWNALLAGTGIATPSNLWLSQQASGNLADSIGGTALVPNNGPSYQNTVAGWSRKAVGTVDGGGNQDFQSTSLGNTATTSGLLLSFVAVTSTPAAEREVLGLGAGADHRYAAITTAPVYKAAGLGGSGSAIGSQNPGTTVRIVAHQVDRAHTRSTTFTDQGEMLTPTWTNPTGGGALLIVGDAVAGSASARYLYTVFWSGASAEMSQTQISTMMSRLKAGPGLTSVTIGGQLAQKLTYDASGLLAKITDASSNQIATFAYSSTTVGQTNIVSTPRGTVGFEFNSARTGCTGKTALYFNKGSAASCSIDTDCGAGMMCGGKTGTGSTGQCFLAARCLTLATSFGESVVTNVDPIGPGGGACSGACTDVAQYVWNTATSNVIRAIGVKDPLGNYTSATYNPNGLPDTIAYGDTDANPATTGYQRIVYLKYDGAYPGLLKEVRRKSELNPGTCNATVSTGCALTTYNHSTDTHLMTTIVESGTTLNISGGNVGYSNTTTFSYDGKGRMTQIDGAVANIKTQLAYTTTADPFLDGFLHDIKAYKDATNYLQPVVLSYDFWGNPTGVATPDGTVSCQTFDAARGYLSQRREAMNGQTDCSTTHSSDLTTTWVRDSALRISQLTRPDGSCMFWEYDTAGRLARTKRRDDCIAASAGDREEYFYNSEGLLTEIQTLDATSAIKRKQLMSYFASRRLSGLTNPVDITKSTNLLYDAAGMVTEIDGAGALGKTTYTINADRRVTAETRYKDAANSDTWQLLFDWLGGQTKVTDGDAKATETVRDDLGRIVKITSPDTAFPTLRIYDSASRVTSIVEFLNTWSLPTVTHTFTYDALSRPLNDDYYNACLTGTPHAEIMRSYDVPAEACPATTNKSCARTAGHLAWVSATLLCSSAYADGSLDQKTWYAYDDAGRMTEDYVSDDTSRIASTVFFWTKNGALSRVVTPASIPIDWAYGSASSNSDTDLVTMVDRTSSLTPVIDTVKWFPYGPLQQYHWQATSAGTGLLTYITRNLAYRTTFVGNAELATLSSALDGVTITEDAKGRVTARDYWV